MYQPAMLLLRVLVIVLLWIQDVTGIEESSGDQDHGSVGSYSGNGQSILTTNVRSDCDHDVYKNFSDGVLCRQLGNLTSNGLINITADVMLLSIVSLVALENVSIIGHDNPTVNCDNAGGIYFDNCHNCTIVGITWEKCGNKTNSKPAIELYDSSNIIIQNCSFQDSIAQAIALSEMSGNVSINSCKFVSNNYFEGNGTAIHYISKIRHHFKFQFMIINCNFTQNGASYDTSLVYISPSSNQSVEQVYFINNTFLSNPGGLIYISYQKVIVSGFLMFEKNKVSSGARMFIINHSNIIFKNSSVKFINNMVTDNGRALHIQNSNIVFCVTTTVKLHDNKAILYITQNSNVTFEENSTLNVDGTAFLIHYSDVTFKGSSAVTISNNQANYYGAALYTSYNSNFTFEENSTLNVDGTAFYIYYSEVTFKGSSAVTISNNQADNNGGALYISYNSDVTFEENSTLNVDGTVLHLYNSDVTFKGSSAVTISNNQADNNGGALYISYNSDVTFEGNSTVTISNNQADNGGALYISYNSDVTFEGNSTVTISNNQADNGGALYISYNSDVTFEGNSTVTISNNQADYYGGALYIIQNCSVKFEGNSTVMISNNSAGYDGALYIRDNSDVTFAENSIVKISNNRADNNGGGLHINNSNVTFEGNSMVTISNNQADNNGGAIYIRDNSDVTFEENSTVTIYNNQADNNGGGLFVNDNSDVIFKGNCAINFDNNTANNSGGALYLIQNCNMSFKEDSCVVFYSNTAGVNGGAFSTSDNCSVIIKGNSNVAFNNNSALGNGGAMYSEFQNVIIFQVRATVEFNDNKATVFGGAVCSRYNSEIMFENDCSVTFSRNEAFQGGAMFAQSIVFNENSSIKFDNNKATFGGAFHVSSITFKENTYIKFENNKAIINGGAIHSDNSNIIAKQNSIIIFNNNIAENGGAIFASTATLLVSEYSDVTFDKNSAGQNGGAIYFNDQIYASFNDSSEVTWTSNTANNYGGAIYSKITQKSRYNSEIMFENDCTVTFSRNEAFQGGAIFTPSIVFNENSSVQFDNNKATFGGAFHVSSITFKENTYIKFESNKAIINGGAIYSDNSNIIAKQNSIIIFNNNIAENGGAIFASTATLLVSEYSDVTFDKNSAGQNGGAIYFNDQIYASFNDSSEVTWTSNTANNYGGAIYSKITQNTKYVNISEINGSDNTAGVAGNLLYIDVPKSCRNICFADRVVGGSNQTLYQSTFDRNVATTPKILQLYNTAKCIGNESAQCQKYYINNIMLGQEILIYPCLLDHYNNPAEVTQFRIIGDNNQNFSLYGLEYTSISCNHTVEGINIVGNKTISGLPSNYSMNFTSYATGREVISTTLTVELSPCHPGFQYQNKSHRCECYNNSRIVSCSGSSSTIARGYWFGYVTEIPTIAICPINYCNFGCCRTTNGYYQLSPERVNQCKSHRSGTACGSCEEGYTLSYGSVECISTNKCSAGLITLVVILTVLYWFVIVVAVFIIMYYRVGIGYFYVLTYYYSVVDIMLSQHTDLLGGLDITITIMSSIAQISPQFLGQLCLFKNMSGIDQQFIRYIHPLAVSVILIIISWLARHSNRLSMFISRGIIQAICFLLLLSYTSVATTSLLLMRPLIFADVDNLYAYLSPDIQYFHGCHLAYGITAIMLALLIVIGLPLLLLTEPFLNRKINYFRIKPLLDQFQGCYKDKYRWFAAYYMICRLIIIIIIIANFSDVFISRYLLLTASTIIALVHETIRPYANNILNIFDGTILQLMVLVTALPLFESFDSSLVIGISFVLVILPLVQFAVMMIYSSRQTLMKVTKNVIKFFQDKDVPDNNAANDAENNDVNLVIDDSMRRNATVATIYEE